jgi:peptidyl-prolyl cis-trans isomerase B (cyclophilin B)
MASGKSTPNSSSKEGNELATAWEKAEKAIVKNKPDQALAILREVDAKGTEAKTLHLAGHATWLKAKSTGSVGDYRKAAKLLNDSLNMNPRDKKTNSTYNELKNEMQNKGIGETAFPKLLSNGAPTLAGIVTLFLGLVTVLALLQYMNSHGTETTDIVELRIEWSESGVEKSGTITLELYPDKAPIHVENFKEIVDQGEYDNTIFHRIIDDFMIQGGDFTNADGTGGHALVWSNLCNGQDSTDSSCSGQGNEAWTIPDEADNGLVHEPCTISMAKTSQANTGGSQFFLIPQDSNGGEGPSWLDGVHTVFGKITSGCDIVTTLSEVETASNDKPVNNVVLVSATFVGQSESQPWYQFW